MCCVLAAFAVTTAHAQSARWEPADSGDTSELQLVFEDCAPEGDPQLPRVEGLTFSLLGRSEQTSIVNLSMTRSTVLTYRARGQQSGPIRIPAFSVQTNKGAVRVPAFTGGAIRSAADANVVSRLEPGAPSVWAGEVFSLTYTLDVARRSFNQLGTNIEWNAAPLAVEEWSKFEPTETTVNGEARLHITSRTRAYAKAPGPLTLNAANQLVNLQSGSIGFGLFQTPRIEQLSVVSNQPSVMVRPLPPAPPGFSGAVGQFKLTSKIIPTAATVGEPITWTLELSGAGNWPEIAGLSQREVSKDFNVVQPQAKRTPAEGKLFDTTLSEDVVLVPTRAGSYTLAPVSFTYFDPSSGSYKTISSPRTTVTVAPVAAATTPPAATVGTPVPGPGATEETRLPKIPPPTAAPIGIPREPLPGAAVVMAPLRAKVVAVLALLPFALLLLFWGWLALRRAQRNDPAHERREARTRLSATLASLRTSREDNRVTAAGAQLLLRWQHDTATLWAVFHAAPSASAFDGNAAPSSRPSAQESAPLAPPTAGAWSQLWLEADRALYSASGELPADWIERAETALAAKRVPGFRAYTLLLPRNLLPFVATLFVTLSLALPAPTQAAEASRPSSGSSDPIAAYTRGDFAAAEKTWAQTLAIHPTDAIARHNLSLALAQQDRWGEAAAHAAAAFVQHPGSAPTRWQLALAAEKAGYIPAPLAGFLPAGPKQTLARLASPGAWQMVLVIASAVFAAGIAALLLSAYHQRSRRRTWITVGVLGLALLAALAAELSLRTYGATADRRAVVVWRAGTLRSIPTEADTTQKTTVLPAGSVALETKTFLGWLQLTFDNGQTGWVRQEDVIALWR